MQLRLLLKRIICLHDVLTSNVLKAAYSITATSQPPPPPHVIVNFVMATVANIDGRILVTSAVSK